MMREGFFGTIYHMHILLKKLVNPSVIYAVFPRPFGRNY